MGWEVEKALFHGLIGEEQGIFPGVSKTTLTILVSSNSSSFVVKKRLMDGLTRAGSARE
jgi:hypothetical protein